MVVFDTTRPTGIVQAGQALFPPQARLRLDPRSLYVLRARQAASYEI